MTRKADPRSIVTPYAFQIAPRLLNRPLASPWRRGWALLIDLALVALLAEIDAVILLGLVILVMVLRRLGWQMGRSVQTAVYVGLAAWLFLNITLSVLESQKPPVTTSQVNSEELTNCDTLCATRLAAEVLEMVFSGDERSEAEVAADLMSRYPLTKEQAKEIAAEVAANKDEVPQLPKQVQENLDNNLGETTVGKAISEQVVADTLEKVGQGQEAPEPVGLIDWFQAIIGDLGLGFGWAAAYFTYFTARFRGQTLGKKLMRIRVMQLDNSPLSMWDAFGRYGGYGAGLATGLLGFIQVFWDPNRQAIHDKIAATVVVDLRSKARQQARQLRKALAEQSG